MEDTWWKKLLNALGMELCINNSWSGSRVTTTKEETSAGCMTRCENLGDNPNVIIIYLGINDFNNEVELGTYNGTEDFPTVTTTFREAYAIMLNKILTKYPTSEVWVCTLPYCEKNGDINFPESNGSSVLLKDYNDAIRELADLFNVRVLEHAKCGLTYHNMSVYMGDYSSGLGLHPNAYGHSLIANNDIRQMDSFVRTRYAITEEVVTLSSISATYSGGSVVVGTDVSTLTGVSVTATYSNGSTAKVTDYTISGTIAEGSNTVTVSYGGMTTTFVVTGVNSTVTIKPVTVDGFSFSVGYRLTDYKFNKYNARAVSYLTDGVVPYDDSETLLGFNAYPVEIPDGAISASVKVADGLTGCGVLLFASDKSRLFETGWVTDTTIVVDISAYPKSVYLGISCKGASNEELSTVDATSFSVTFS